MERYVVTEINLVKLVFDFSKAVAYYSNTLMNFSYIQYFIKELLNHVIHNFNHNTKGIS